MSLRQFVPPPFKPPFSHVPGIQGWLVGSNLYAQFFPTAFFMYDVSGAQKASITFSLTGPVAEWTVFFDMLRQKTTVQGVSPSGFFRFELLVEQKGIFLKSLKSDLSGKCNGKQCVFEKKKKFVLVEGDFSFPRFKGPQLLLGMNKDPNLDRILLHPNMLEILPLWYQMAMPKKRMLDATSLLGSLSGLIEEKKRLQVIEKCMQFFTAGFSGFFVPKKEDTLFLGYQEPLLPKDFVVADVHEMCVALIRSLFLEEKENSLSLLPCLPKECVCGHLLREKLLSGSQISLEWRKGMLRRALIHPVQDETISLVLQHGIKSFCLTVLGSPHPRKITLQADSPLELKQGKRYLLDNFSNNSHTPPFVCV